LFKGVPEGELGAGWVREKVLKTLTGGSQPSDYLPYAGSQPIPRFELNQALQNVRRDAGLESHDDAPKESLLLISGSVDPAEGYFCRHPIPEDPASPALSQWAKGVRKMLVLEVWSEAFATELERSSRAQPAPGAPAGIYSCIFPNSDGGNITLYGVVPASLSDTTRAVTFDWLTAQAKSRLRP
jgi:hypothetical protein